MSTIDGEGRDAPTIVERAAAILRQELADGALANITASSRMWLAHRPGLVGTEVSRRLRADLDGLIDPLLDLLAPPATATDRWPVDVVRRHGGAPTRQSREAIPVLQSSRSVPPGGAAEIRTGLRNDGPHSVDLNFVCSDLVAEPGERIRASCVQLQPERMRLSPGASIDLLIGLAVPADTRPGIYHGLLQATDLRGLRALLTFPVR